MRSFVTFAVDHGEDTDTLQRFIDGAHAEDPSGNEGFVVIDYTVKVDVGPVTVAELERLLAPIHR